MSAAVGPGVVVVGAALAGISVAEALRAHGHAGVIQLIDADPQPQFDRPPLSKQILTGTWLPERALLRSAEQIASSGIDIRAGRRATGLDRAGKRVLLEDGQSLRYDTLVIATGARARRLPTGIGMAGVHVLRGMEDALALRLAMQAARNVAIIGAGFIGTEVAAAARSFGLPVALLDRVPTILSRVCGAEFAAAVARMHQARGVVIRLGVGVDRLLGSARVEGVALSDGTQVAADLVVVGIGTEPDVEWLQGSDLESRGGVACDACGRAAPDVYAIGDVASWRLGASESYLRVEQWSSAIEQARSVAARIADPEFAERYVPAPSYVWSDQYGVKLQFAGRFDAAQAEEKLIETESPDRFAALYFEQGRLAALAVCNWLALFVKGRRLVAARADSQTVLAALRSAGSAALA